MSVQTDQSSILHTDTQNDGLQAPAPRQGSAGSGVFRSILFDGCDSDAELGSKGQPEFFTDLNLDQIVESITAGRDEYNLKPFFYAPLKSVEAIHYRQDVLRDLENPALLECVRSFADEMKRMRACLALAEKLYYKYQKQTVFLNAVDIYCCGLVRLARDLSLTALGPRGLLALREYLTNYTESADFTALVAETKKLRDDLGGIRYSLLIEGKRITVGKYHSELDYSAEVLATSDKFRQGTAKEYRFGISSSLEMNHLEAAVLELVAKLYPEVFASLKAYCSRHHDYLNRVIAAFDREVQFYLACMEHIQRFKQAGLPSCYPEVTDRSKEIYGCEVFDLSLADKLMREHASVVTNDFYLKDPERIFVVSGPNQGGKTTFARTLGQLHYLASLGCPVPGSEAKLFLCDRLFTHFEREEDIRNLTGKLEEELLRIHAILERATPNSILIMNESFLSTTLNDALFLGKQVMQRIIALGMLCVSVTFLNELASLSNVVVSMVSTVKPEDPALRTFKIARKSADGLAYATAIAEKYGLTHEAVRARISANAEGGNPS